MTEEQSDDGRLLSEPDAHGILAPGDEQQLRQDEDSERKIDKNEISLFLTRKLMNIIARQKYIATLHDLVTLEGNSAAKERLYNPPAGSIPPTESQDISETVPTYQKHAAARKLADKRAGITHGLVKCINYAGCNNFKLKSPQRTNCIINRCHRSTD